MMNAAFKAAGMTVFERGWLSCNNVLFDGGPTHESVLVDTGFFSHANQTLALVTRLLQKRPLDRIVNTHLHSDHCGGNHLLQSAFDCAIDVPLGEAEKVDSWDEDALSYRATGQHCPRFKRTGALANGGEIQLGAHRWRILAAPGHDPESIVLYQPELEVLISADALWENGFGVVFPEIEGTAAFADVQKTLDVLRGLHARCIVPGHGAPFTGLEAALDRAQRRLGRFVADPVLHAAYAAKVLIKFHMLEIHQEVATSLFDWCTRTRYLQLTYRQYFSANSFTQWLGSLLDGMISNGALRRSEGLILNK
jgi:glyoxylase-like metal-dependent hydrolase (beta-lactamase superfamily II)